MIVADVADSVLGSVTLKYQSMTLLAKEAYVSGSVVMLLCSGGIQALSCLNQRDRCGFCGL